MKVTNVLAALAIVTAFASAPARGQDSFAAAKSAQIELLRARLGADPSPAAWSTLIEAENLLRQYEQAPAKQKQTVGTQLDAALTRLDLEIAAGSRGQ